MTDTLKPVHLNYIGVKDGGVWGRFVIYSHQTRFPMIMIPMTTNLLHRLELSSVVTEPKFETSFRIRSNESPMDWVSLCGVESRTYTTNLLVLTFIFFGSVGSITFRNQGRNSYTN